MSAGSEVDPELLERIAAGSGRAFRALYDAFAPKVYQYAMMRTGSVSDLEEILQETMLSVWSGRSQLASRDSIAAWIFGIARNKTVDRLRRSRAQQAVPLDVAIASVIADGADQTGWIDARDALSRLSDEERDLILMMFLLGMTYEEAGQALGVPVGTVKSRVHHLRRKLKADLGGKRSHGSV